MSVVLVFLLVVFSFSFWWLAHQRILSKPWLERGAETTLLDPEFSRAATAKVALGVFLSVVGVVFALFASAYFMRMEYSDWQPPPLPRILWLYTFVLVLASAAFSCAVRAIHENRIAMVRLALSASAFGTLVFLAGQITAWRELSAGGYFLDSNPANGFFYLMTGVHGLHIIGGLIALGRIMARGWNLDADQKQLALGIGLCATYWHFLLLVWLAVFALLAGWAGDFVAFCQQLLT